MKATNEFKTIFSASNLSPLEKLYSLQSLSIMDYFKTNLKHFGSDLVLTQDENIHILAFIIIQSSVPDLASQIELITAFASEYMQESSDGCEISRTYLQLIACIQYL